MSAALAAPPASAAAIRPASKRPFIPYSTAARLAPSGACTKLPQLGARVCCGEATPEAAVCASEAVGAQLKRAPGHCYARPGYARTPPREAKDASTEAAGL